MLSGVLKARCCSALQGLCQGAVWCALLVAGTACFAVRSGFCSGCLFREPFVHILRGCPFRQISHAGVMRVHLVSGGDLERN